MIEISRKTFDEASTKTQMGILFDLMAEVHQDQRDHPLACIERFNKLEARKNKDTASASIFGLVGGMLAILGKKLIGL
jgi:hypothetical protein